MTLALVRLRARRPVKPLLVLAALFILALVPACSNNPYPPAEGKIIAYAALGEDPRTLDPAQVGDTVSAQILCQVYDALYQNAYLPRPYKVEPAIARDYPEKRIFSEEIVEKGVKKSVPRMEYTFRLRDDVYFQDDPCFPGGRGRRVTSRDVAYAIKRLADPTVQSTGWWLVSGKIKGIDAFSGEAAAAGKADYTMEIEGISCPDDLTLKVTLTQPNPMFIYVMSMPYTAPVPREAVDYYNAPGRPGFARHPVGTGAYRLKSWERQHRIVLEKNPTYRKDFYPTTGAPGDREKGLLDDAGKRMPFSDEVWFTVISAGQPAWLLFLQGYLDASGIPKEQFDKAITKSLELSDEFVRKGISLEVTTNLDVFYINFNMRDPVLGKNKCLRQALSLAYDSDLFNEIFLNGRALNAEGPLPPGVFGYDPTLKSPFKTHDLAKAKELLAKAGYPGGIDPKTGRQLVLTYDIGSDSTMAREYAAFDIRCFEQLGIKVRLQVNTFSQYLERTMKGTFQMSSGGWMADYPDPEDFLMLFYGPNAPPGPNASAFSDPEYDRLYEQMKVMEDTPEREALVRRMVAIIVDECPWIFNYHAPSYVLRHSWRKNGKAHSISGNYIKYLRVEPEVRQAYWKVEDRPDFKPLLYIIGILVLVSTPAVIITYRRRRR